MRIAILGDVQGWSVRLAEALTGLGADCGTGVLPDGLSVIQVGDLIHKGPDSVACLALVDRFLEGSPGRWYQLMGNHEAFYFPSAPRFTVEELSLHHQMDLVRWRRDGQLRLAAAIETPGGDDVHVTHAGLTGARWRLLGEPVTAIDAAAAIEEEAERLRFREALRAGEMLNGGRVDHSASVVWASCTELLGSWTGKALPFSQIVGHTNPYRWQRMTWPGYYDDDLRRAARLDPKSHHVEFVWSTGKTIVFVDPSYGKRWAGVPLVPHIVEGEVVR